MTPSQTRGQDLGPLRGELDGLTSESDDQRRRLHVLGVISDAFRGLGHEAVLVGGGALEFYTRGGYSTKDLDLGLPTGPDIDAVFNELGFSKEGRYWVREDLDVLVEAPAPPGVPEAEARRTEVEIAGHRIVVIGVEDVLLDRLRAAVHWKSDEDGRWARRLAELYREELDWEYLQRKTREDPLEARALEELEGGSGENSS